MAPTTTDSCRRILVAGCGYVGSRLAAQLVRDGHRVWGLRRASGSLPAGVEPVTADLGEAGLAARLPRELQQVVFAAAAGGGPEEAYHRLFVDGLGRLLDALDADRHPVERLVLVSSTGVYGQQDGEWVDEDSPAEPRLASGRAMLAAEALAAAAPWTTVTVRFAGIYGPGRIRLIRSLRDRDGPLRVSTSPRYLNQIHRDDGAGALRHLLHLPNPAPLYLACDHEPAPRLDVLTWIAHRLGLPAPAPTPANTTADPYAGNPRGNKRCRNARLRASGYQLQFPSYREGYESIIRDLSSH
jgi:nucleoside-diphosphate-sugar epimerase